MAMLAEKREKKVIRSYMLKSKPLTSDSCKVGQRLLEKMGWTPGKGLGVNEDGCPDPLRIKYKCDIKGLGFKDCEKDALTCQEDFNNFLTKLSQQIDHSSESDKKEDEDTALNSLEIRSKKSRARVHYQKFTRGKDLSRASSKDLESILGFSSDISSKKAVSNESPHTNSMSNDADLSKQQEEEKENDLLSIEMSGGSDCSLEFQQKKQKNRKDKPRKNKPKTEDQNLHHDEETPSSERRKSVTWGDVKVSYVSKYISDMVDTSHESVQNVNIASSSNILTNKKSKPKKRKSLDGIASESSEGSQNLICHDLHISVTNKEKKKKKRMKESDAENSSSLDKLPEVSQLDLSVKQKKKRKGRNEDTETAIVAVCDLSPATASNNEIVTESQCMHSNVSKIKKQKNEKPGRSEFGSENVSTEVKIVCSDPKIANLIQGTNKKRKRKDCIYDLEDEYKCKDSRAEVLKNQQKCKKKNKKIKNELNNVFDDSVQSLEPGTSLSCGKESDYFGASVISSVNNEVDETEPTVKTKRIEGFMKTENSGVKQNQERKTSLLEPKNTTLKMKNGMINDREKNENDDKIVICSQEESADKPRKKKHKKNKKQKLCDDYQDLGNEITSHPSVVLPEDVKTAGFICKEALSGQKMQKPCDQPGESPSSKPTLSLLTEERIAKWKKRHRICLSSDNNISDSENLLKSQILDKFAGSNLDSIKGYGCAVLM